MLGSLRAESSAAIVPPTMLSVRALCRRLTAWLGACRQRRQECAELLAFMATDHRAAADIGVTAYEAINWSERPFWRA
jgi:uncharacterized protein YjiS (DUF1127 family)